MGISRFCMEVKNQILQLILRGLCRLVVNISKNERSYFNGFYEAFHMISRCFDHVHDLQSFLKAYYILAWSYILYFPLHLLNIMVYVLLHIPHTL